MTIPYPFADLGEFPVARLEEGERLWRVVKTTYRAEPWYFSHDDNRFDLSPHSPAGTCYLAEDPYAAILETVYRDAEPTGDLDRLPPLAPEEVANLEMHELALPHTARVADLSPDPTHDLHTAFGTTGNQLGSQDSYEAPQQWAQSFNANGFDGLLYPVRRGSGRLGVALFADRGPHDWGPPAATHEIDEPSVHQWREELPGGIVPPPAIHDVTVLDTPEQ